MTVHDIVPTVPEAAADEPDLFEDWLVETFDELADEEHARRIGHHDRDGYFAHEAGSAKCVALGHASRVDEGHPLFDAWDAEHPYGWSGERLCLQTRYGEACSGCEGDCEFTIPPSLWQLPGVTGERRR